MPYNSGTGAYERRSTTVIDATPDGDTVAVAIDVKLDQGIDDYVTDLNHHKTNWNHYPATSVHTDSRFLKQSPAGAISWADGVVAADAALKDFSNVVAATVAASDTKAGLVELATNAEAAALSDTARAIVPSSLGSLFAKSHAASGYQKLPNGLILQWGSGTFANGTSFTFPISFLTYALVFASPVNYDPGAAIYNKVASISAYNITTSGFLGSSSTGGGIGGAWFAVGY